ELIGNASAGRAAIVMQRCPVDVAQRPWTFLSEFLEKTVGPGIIVDVRTGGDECQFDTEARNPFDESPEFDGIIGAGERPSATPALIANTPEANRERIWFAALRAHVSHGGCASRRVTVFNPFVEIPRASTAQVAREVGLG